MPCDSRKYLIRSPISLMISNSFTYIRWGMTPASVGGEQQLCISGGFQSPIWYTLREDAQEFGLEVCLLCRPEFRAKTRERVLNVTVEVKNTNLLICNRFTNSKFWRAVKIKGWHSTMIYNIVEVESIKLGVGNIESLGLSSKEVLKKSISWLRERYEVTEDIS